MIILEQFMQKLGWFPWPSIWYDLQGYDDGTVTWTTLSSHLHHYFIPSNYKRRARKALAAYFMGNRSVTEYIQCFLQAPCLLCRCVRIGSQVFI